MYILVFHKEHKNADNMELDEHQEWASELERHRGSKFVWVQFYFHHIGMEALQVCSALQWDTRVASKGLCRSSPLMLHIISKQSPPIHSRPTLLKPPECT